MVQSLPTQIPFGNDKQKSGSDSIPIAALLFYTNCGVVLVGRWLGGERGVGDRGSAVRAVSGCGFDGAVAGGAVSDSECRWWYGVRCCGAKDLVGDVDGLRDVVLTDAVGHEEAFDPRDDHGDAGPTEEEIDDAGGVAA
jgi:hypothetical protein